MAYDYYQWPTGNSDTSSSTNTWAGNATASTPWIYGDSNTSCTSTPWIIRLYRRFLTPCPKGWTHDDEIAFTHLLNRETKTGFRVEMLISGDVLITDPDVEVREMRALVPLIKSHASEADCAKIEAFFAAHPFEQGEA